MMVRALLIGLALCAASANAQVLPPAPIHRDAVEQLDASSPFITGAEYPEFGRSAALSGVTLAIGAQGAGPGSLTNAGAVVLFERPGLANITSKSAGWREKATITAPVPEAQALFGNALAIAPGRLVVGAPGTTVNGRVGQGVAYVFEPDGMGGWTARATLQAPDGADGELFGSAITIAGDRAVVGALRATAAGVPYAGKAYVFNLNATGNPAPIQILSVTGASAFGTSLANEGSTLVVGAPQTAVDGLGGRGAVYAYERQGSGFTLRTMVVNPVGRVGDQFGYMIAINNNRMAVSSPTGWNKEGVRSGIITLFNRTGDSFVRSEDVAPTNAVAGDLVGLTMLSINNDTLLASAPVATVHDHDWQGMAHVFSLDAKGHFVQTQEWFDEMGESNDYFGWAGLLVSPWGADAVVTGMGVRAFQGSAMVYRSPRAYIMASAGPGGTMTPSGISYPLFGQTNSYRITASPGWRIAGVAGCPGSLFGSSTSAMFTTSPAGVGGCALRATFRR